MPIELDALSAALQNYVVSPLNAFGLGGFVFDIEGEATTRLVAEITDHYTEDNKAVQDHIARRPKAVTLRGYVGELVYKPDGSGGAGAILQTLTPKLTEISAFLPSVSTATQQLQSVVTNQSVGFNEGLSDSADIFALVKNILAASGDMANQQNAYNYFQACWEQGILMGIQTPWAFLTNMAIESVVAIQDEKTNSMSDFAVTYKQMRFAKTISAAYSPPSAGGTTSLSGNNPGDLSTQSNYAALQTYRAANGMDTPTIDKVLMGVAAVQAPDPVSIGAVSGVGLPSNLLNGAQQYISQASDLSTNPSVAAIFKRAGAQ
jgi:hypothetical protein